MNINEREGFSDHSGISSQNDPDASDDTIYGQIGDAASASNWVPPEIREFNDQV